MVCNNVNIDLSCVFSGLLLVQCCFVVELLVVEYLNCYILCSRDPCCIAASFFSLYVLGRGACVKFCVNLHDILTLISSRFNSRDRFYGFKNCPSHCYPNMEASTATRYAPSYKLHIEL